jgi:hypothetical protein
MRAIGAFLIFGLSALGVALTPRRLPPPIRRSAPSSRATIPAPRARARSGEERQLFFDLPVFSAERVDTGVEASTALNLLDNTHLQVGPNSSVVLDRFVYDPERHTGEAAISFSRGLFRFVTGEMKNKDGFDLRTPSATLAIRGTKFIVFVAADGRSDISVIEARCSCGRATAWSTSSARTNPSVSPAIAPNPTRASAAPRRVIRPWTRTTPASAITAAWAAATAREQAAAASARPSRPSLGLPCRLGPPAIVWRMLAPPPIQPSVIGRHA